MKILKTYAPWTERMVDRIFSTQGKDRGKAIIIGVAVQLTFFVAVAVIIRLTEPGEHLSLPTGLFLIAWLVGGVVLTGLTGSVGVMILLGNEATYAKVKGDIPTSTAIASLWIYVPALGEQIVNRLRRRRTQVEVSL